MSRDPYTGIGRIGRVDNVSIRVLGLTISELEESTCGAKVPVVHPRCVIPDERYLCGGLDTLLVHHQLRHIRSDSPNDS